MKLTKEKKSEIIQKIEESEHFAQSAGGRLSGISIKATKLRVKGAMAVCDIKVRDDGVTYSFTDIEYPLGGLGIKL